MKCIASFFLLKLEITQTKHSNKKQLCTKGIILVSYWVRRVQRLMHDKGQCLLGFSWCNSYENLSATILFVKNKNLYSLTSSPSLELRFIGIAPSKIYRKLADMNSDHICNFARHQNRIKFELKFNWNQFVCNLTEGFRMLYVAKAWPHILWCSKHHRDHGIPPCWGWWR